jgi:hypothetical protein
MASCSRRQYCSGVALNIVRMSVMAPRTAHLRVCYGTNRLGCGNGDRFFSSSGRKFEFWLFQPRRGGPGCFWLQDATLEESDSLPDPAVLAQEIVEDLEAALEQFCEIAADLASKDDES